MAFYNNSTSLGAFSVNFSIPFVPLPTSRLIPWTVVTFLQCFIGTFNNILILLITRPRPGDKSALNLLIFHFIILNLIMCCFNVPVRCAMVQLKQSSFLIPSVVCLYVQPVYSIVVMVISWTDAALAVNRCIGLFLPHHYTACSTRKITLCLIGVTWIVSLANLLPPSFGYGGFMIAAPFGGCSFRPWSTASMGLLFNALYYLPYAVVGTGSVLILWKVCHSTRNAVGVQQAGVNRRVRLARMVLFTFSWTAVCNIPLFLVVSQFIALPRGRSDVNLWLQTLAASQYAFTPCVLLASHADYRARVVQLWQRHRRTTLDDSLETSRSKRQRSGGPNSAIPETKQTLPSSVC